MLEKWFWLCFCNELRSVPCIVLRLVQPGPGSVLFSRASGMHGPFRTTTHRQAVMQCSLRNRTDLGTNWKSLRGQSFPLFSVGIFGRTAGCDCSCSARMLALVGCCQNCGCKARRRCLCILCMQRYCVLFCCCLRNGNELCLFGVLRNRSFRLRLL